MNAESKINLCYTNEQGEIGGGRFLAPLHGVSCQPRAFPPYFT